MQKKKLLIAFLLGTGLYFMPGLGYGEVDPYGLDRIEATVLNADLLKARIDYIMMNPTSFLYVDFSYDQLGDIGKVFLPKTLNTKGKILVWVEDKRGMFSNKSGEVLLNAFKKNLEKIYSFIHLWATDMDTDIIAKFYSKERFPLGYFYQGKYYLWENKEID